SLITTGTPPSGSQARFLRRASNASAALIAPAPSSGMKTFRLGLGFARGSAAEVNALLVIFPAHSSAAAFVIVILSGSIALCANADPASEVVETMAQAMAEFRKYGRRAMRIPFSEGNALSLDSSRTECLSFYWFRFCSGACHRATLCADPLGPSRNGAC